MSGSNPSYLKAIGGHDLPTLLVDLIEKDRWRINADRLATILRQVGGVDFSPDCVCLTPKGMSEMLKRSLRLGRLADSRGVPGAWDAYGFRSSERSGGTVQLPWLDLDHAVPIITADDEMSEIWLDYRNVGNTLAVRAVAPRRSLATRQRGRDFFVVSEDAAAFLRRIT